MRGNRSVIHISRMDSERFMASFHSEVLDAVFAVSFPETVSGAVALHRFAKMIEHSYGVNVELRIDEPFALRNKAIQDLVQYIDEGVPVAG